MTTELFQPQQPRITRRVMLPVTEEKSREAADIEDARLVRWGLSPSYHINLGSLSGNRYTGYNEIFPRVLYPFYEVHPTGINESEKRLDEEAPDTRSAATRSRQPKTCAEDVVAEADDRVFVVPSAFVGRSDAQDLWDVIYPIGVEADIFAMTERDMRGPVPEHLEEWYAIEGLEKPYKKKGNALVAFIKHLEIDAPRMIREAREQGVLTYEQFQIAEIALNSIVTAANQAYRHRYARLQTTFGLIDQRKNSGIGRNRLVRADWQSLAETGISRPEDKPVEASKQMGEAIAENLKAQDEQTQGQLAQAVDRLAKSQELTQAALLELLEERKREREKGAGG